MRSLSPSLCRGRARGRRRALSVSIDADDLGGVVTGPKGPEAGVWVIAETTDLPTKFAKIVVTDDRGRYVVPDLPKASYSVWVRGYGLVDSPKIQATPGKILNLTAVVAPNAARSRRVLPGGLLVLHASCSRQERVPGHRAQRERHRADNGEPGPVAAQPEVGLLLGVPRSSAPKGRASSPQDLGTFPSSAAAWERRLQSGQAGAQMISGLGQLGRERALAVFADWTDRIAAGRSAAGAAAAAGPRAQRRDHPVGLGRSEGLPPRLGVDRSAQPDGQRQRAALRCARAQRRLSAGARSGAPHDEPGAVDRPRPEHAADAARR